MAAAHCSYEMTIHNKGVLRGQRIKVFSLQSYLDHMGQTWMWW